MKHSVTSESVLAKSSDGVESSWTRANGTTNASLSAVEKLDCVQPATAAVPGKRKKKKMEVVRSTPQEHKILDVIKGNPEEPEFNREFRRALLERFSGGVFSVETPRPPGTPRAVPHGLARSLSSRLVTLITTRLSMEKPNVLQLWKMSEE